MAQQVLIVDDDADTCEGLGELLAQCGYEVTTAGDLAAAREACESEAFDAILLDLYLPDGDGREWIPELRATSPEVVLIVVTADTAIDSAVAAMKQGADHYLTKPLDLDALKTVLRRGLEVGNLRRKARPPHARQSPEIYQGTSEASQGVWRLAETAAASESPILLTGPTGTGKGVLARWIHDRSPRAAEAYVELNCSALGGGLLASELFGHRKGAFTSAVDNRKGLIAVADGGSLFLDEIGDMDLGVQAQLLKVLEEKKYRRLGDTRMRHSDFRLLCATNRDLQEAVADKRFREDLYYRICVFPIRVPALRQRQGELPDMIRHQWRQVAPKSPPLPEDIVRYLAEYGWPGNFRELRNVLERAALLAQGRAVRRSDLPALHAAGSDTGPASASGEIDWSLQHSEAQHLRKALQHFEHDVARAAEAIGISRATLYRKLKKHGIAPQPA